MIGVPTPEQLAETERFADFVECALDPQAAAEAVRVLRAENERLTREARRCNAIGHPTVTPHSLVPCQLDRGHEGDHYSTTGCAGGAVSWPVAERDALASDVERLKGALAKLRRLGVERDDSWQEGYATGCVMSHAIGCDAIRGERDVLAVEVERLTEERNVYSASLAGTLDKLREVAAVITRVRELRNRLVAAANNDHVATRTSTMDLLTNVVADLNELLARDSPSTEPEPFTDPISTFKYGHVAAPDTEEQTNG